MERMSEDHVALWDEINRFADTRRMSGERMDAVCSVESVLDRTRARIATLEAELAASATKQAETEGLLRNARWEWEMAVEREHFAEAELARVKDLAVWASLNGAYFKETCGLLMAGHTAAFRVECDGTPSGILAALERARGESQ